MNNIERYLQMAMDWAVIFVPKVLIALLILWIGLRLISKLNSLTNKALTSKNIDPTIRPFLASMVDIGLKFLLFIIVAGIFGFEISSIIALLGALAFAIGLALQGSLGHFASGILLLILKPYRVGDEIKVGDVEGFVEEIQVFNTIIRSRDNQLITVPNGLVTTGSIHNYSAQGTRRVDMTFVVDEPNKVSTVKEVINKALKSCPQILDNPAPEVFLHSFDCDELRFSVRPWCKTEDYWQVWGNIQEAIKEGFDEADMTGNVHYVQMINGREEVFEKKNH